MIPDMVALSLALLAVGVLAQFGNYRKGIEMQLNWISAGGLLFLLSYTWAVGISSFGALAQLTPILVTLLNAVAVVFVLVGTIWAVVRLVKI